MDLIEINILGAEPLQAGVDLGHDRLTRQALAIGAGSRPERAFGEKDLRGDHDLVSPRELAEQLADDPFGRSCRIAVRRVEEVDPQVDGALDDGTAIVLTQRPGMSAGIRVAERHASET
jgi:hypothetical protein